MECEVELIGMIARILDKFGFSGFTVKLNNRKILKGISSYLSLDEKTSNQLFREIDKLDKIGQDAVISNISKIVDKNTLNMVNELFFRSTNNLDAFKQYSEEGVAELYKIIDSLDKKVNVVFDPTLVRGLGYYTGPIYEVKLSDELGTVVAGGRYDSLIGLYGEPQPAVGISIGIDRFIDVLRMTKKTNSLIGESKCIYIATVKPNLLGEARDLATRIRDKCLGLDISVLYDLKERNLRKQMEYASSIGATYVVVLGEKEVSSGVYTVRDMESGKQTSLKFDEIINLVCV